MGISLTYTCPLTNLCYSPKYVDEEQAVIQREGEKFAFPDGTCIQNNSVVSRR